MAEKYSCVQYTFFCRAVYCPGSEDAQICPVGCGICHDVIGWLGYADRIEFNTYSESLGMDVAEGDDEMYVRAMEEVVERFISDNCNADAVVRIVTGEELGIDSMEIYIQSDKVDTDGLRSAVSEVYGVDENRITIRRGNTDHMQEGL